MRLKRSRANLAVMWKRAFHSSLNGVRDVFKWVLRLLCFLISHYLPRPVVSRRGQQIDIHTLQTPSETTADADIIVEVEAVLVPADATSYRPIDPPIVCLTLSC